ncbi:MULTISPECIES: TrkH family potassium uptake protein [Isoptericola]|uniref:TrkH family potassium uptake protein n=1 Tax=Isoptericola sediminis TaxID=2733572 RepID=A0A849K5U0_9MICO|nr:MULTISPECIES: potassium transporter TrkG [Isoptericola]MDO8143264.1 potassium transporter TrkG [Isoptericola sp. 178]MDO8147125.1 potassium transporter TrkG [Isoptericola sp. b515]MDO8150560.1 potassium transporter TrkG [Isoptericola sp. b408]NNU26507.1 TrkH family potassium uptake protein [Isoptericola sediminis]
MLREWVDRTAREYPARLAMTVFAAVITLFTLLLLPPWATATDTGARFVDALFTATSAVCITGLVVVDTAEYWSEYGRAVILLGIKVGGLGVMTIASLLGIAVSRRIGLTQKLLTASETKTGTTRLGEVGSLIRLIIVVSTSIELTIALILLPRFLALDESLGLALWHSTFYGISAFNNAGFVPTVDGLLPYASDWLVIIPVVLGVFIGALGFPVMLNLLQARRHGRRFLRHLSLHTKLTITTSVALLVAGLVIIGAMEWANPETLGGQDLSTKFLSALMASVMPRSGGFNTFDVGAMRAESWLVTDALMFVGGGSASTAGGIKVTTLAVMLLAIVAEARGDRDVDVFGRRIPRDTLRLSIAVVFIGATMVLVSCIALVRITDFSLSQILFEVISAFATVGLSTGITGDLPDGGKYWLSALMYLGRVGTISVLGALALRDRRRVIRFPEERPIIG